MHHHTIILLLLNYENNVIDYFFVPPGLTRKVQPFDISVNGSFNSYYKNCYTSHIINTSENLIYFQKPERNDLINLINEIWDSEGKITKKTIINGFIKAEIRKENDFENNVMNNIIIEEVEYKNVDIE